MHAVTLRRCGIDGLRCCGPEDPDYEELGDCQGAFNECEQGLCTACGSDGEACCEGTTCVGVTSFCDVDAGRICSSLCGSAGLRCCDGGFCDYDFFCDSDNYVCLEFTCGEAGQRCCTRDERSRPCDRDARLECLGGTCGPCGFDGEPCCPVNRDRYIPDECYGDSAVCGPDDVCINALPGLSQGCGRGSNECCPGDICLQRTVCTDGRCANCGRSGQQCCLNDRCRMGAACVDGMCGAETCGRLGRPCCDPAIETFVCDSDSDCNDGICEPCGDVGARCCSENRIPCGFTSECLANNTCALVGSPSPAPGPPPLPPPMTPPPPSAIAPAPRIADSGDPVPREQPKPATGMPPSPGPPSQPPAPPRSASRAVKPASPPAARSPAESPPGESLQES